MADPLRDLNRDIKSLLYDGHLGAATTVLVIQSFSFTLALAVRSLVADCVAYGTGSGDAARCTASSAAAAVSFGAVISAAVLIVTSYSRWCQPDDGGDDTAPPRE